MKLLLLEFNEIDADLIDEGIARDELPAFREFKRQSRHWETDAGESGDMLEPWIQWVTLHTAVSREQHGAIQLAQGTAVPQPFVWEILADRGVDVWVCGAMNGRGRPDLSERIVPDYWTVPEPGTPFVDFSRFVNACVGQRIDRRHRLPWPEALRFLRFMSHRGLRLGTIGRSTVHLARAVARRTPWRLAFALEECQTDLFLHHGRRLSPEFAIFFVNSVAHVQHNYWREMRPELFDGSVPPERRRHQSAIPEGYRHLDRLLSRLLAAQSPDTTVVLCSALGQQPYQPEANGRGPVVLRVDDIARLIRTLDLPAPRRSIRTMAGSFTLEYEVGSDARLAVERLRATRVRSQALFRARRHEATRVLVDLALTHELPVDVPVEVEGHALGETTTLGELVSVAHYKSGEHSPRGLLWVRGRFPLAEPDPARPVPLTAVAPTILEFFGQPARARRTG